VLITAHQLTLPMQQLRVVQLLGVLVGYAARAEDRLLLHFPPTSSSPFVNVVSIVIRGVVDVLLYYIRVRRRQHCLVRTSRRIDCMATIVVVELEGGLGVLVGWFGQCKRLFDM